MYRYPLFADCTHSYEDAKFVLFGVPFDATSCFRSGSRDAPAALRAASYNFETYHPELDIDLSEVPMCDIGDMEARGSVEDVLSLVYTELRHHMEMGKVPIMMGGEHSLTIGCIRAACDVYEGVGMVVLDAHLDLRREYEGSEYSHACTSYQCLRVLSPKRYVCIGVRSGSKEEFEYARRMGLIWVPAQKVLDEGMGCVLDDVLDKLECAHVYLSIDADVVDPAYAPAVGTPEPFGLTPEDVRCAIRTLAPRAVGMDVVEITPQYDGGQTTLLFSRLIREFIAAKARGAHTPPRLM